eukprot:Amastigsp_a339769_87.p2 type:complete len:187 gc:universal Amastigsp_a339769_87:924-1484(+)
MRVEPLRHGLEPVLPDSGIPRLVERQNRNLVRKPRVLLDDPLRVLVSRERVHQNQRNPSPVPLVEHLDLLDRKIEERLPRSHLDHRLWPDAAHRRPEPAVELEHSDLAQRVPDRFAGRLGKLGIGTNAIGRRRRDLVPLNLRRALVHVSLEQTRKPFNLGVCTPVGIARKQPRHVGVRRSNSLIKS